MIAGAWLCLLAPLAGALSITLLGTRITRSAAGWISTASVAVAFAGAVWSFFGLRSHGSEHAAPRRDVGRELRHRRDDRGVVERRNRRRGGVGAHGRSRHSTPPGSVASIGSCAQA